MFVIVFDQFLSSLRPSVCLSTRLPVLLPAPPPTVRPPAQPPVRLSAWPCHTRRHPPTHFVLQISINLFHDFRPRCSRNFCHRFVHQFQSSMLSQIAAIFRSVFVRFFYHRFVRVCKFCKFLVRSTHILIMVFLGSCPLLLMSVVIALSALRHIFPLHHIFACWFPLLMCSSLNSPKAAWNILIMERILYLRETSNRTLSKIIYHEKIRS